MSHLTAAVILSLYAANLVRRISISAQTSNLSPVTRFEEDGSTVDESAVDPSEASSVVQEVIPSSVIDEIEGFSSDMSDSEHRDCLYSEIISRFFAEE